MSRQDIALHRFKEIYGLASILEKLQIQKFSNEFTIVQQYTCLTTFLPKFNIFIR